MKFFYFSEAFEKHKQRIQKKLYDALGVRVDQIIKGKGTTKTGNMARRCFEKPKEFANALGIDSELVSNVAIVLQAYKSKKTEFN